MVTKDLIEEIRERASVSAERGFPRRMALELLSAFDDAAEALLKADARIRELETLEERERNRADVWQLRTQHAEDRIRVLEAKLGFLAGGTGVKS